MMIKRKFHAEQTEVRLLTEHPEPVCRMDETIFPVDVDSLGLILESRRLRCRGTVKFLATRKHDSPDIELSAASIGQLYCNLFLGYRLRIVVLPTKRVPRLNCCVVDNHFKSSRTFVIWVEKTLVNHSGVVLKIFRYVL